MKHFKSLTKIKEASVDEIVEVGVPRAVAEACLLYTSKIEEKYGSNENRVLLTSFGYGVGGECPLP